MIHSSDDQSYKKSYILLQNDCHSCSCAVEILDPLSTRCNWSLLKYTANMIASSLILAASTFSTHRSYLKLHFHTADITSIKVASKSARTASVLICWCFYIHGMRVNYLDKIGIIFTSDINREGAYGLVSWLVSGGVCDYMFSLAEPFKRFVIWWHSRQNSWIVSSSWLGPVHFCWKQTAFCIHH